MKFKKFLLMCILLSILSGCNNNDRVVAKVEDLTITAEEVNNLIYQRYYTVVLEEIIDLHLINLKAKELGIPTDLKKNEIYNGMDPKQIEILWI